MLRSFSSHLGFGLVLVAILAAPVLAAQETSDDPACSFDRTLPAKVRWVAASGEDLRVIVDWREDPSLPSRAVIRLFDEAGSLVTSKRVDTVPGETSDLLLTAALIQVPESGFQYRVAVETQGKHPLAPEHDFRVFLDCTGADGCVYDLANGVKTGSLLIRDDFLPVLDILEAAGSSNILGDVVAAGFGFESQVYSLAWQLDRLDGRIPLGSEPCMWMPAFGGQPEKTESAIHIVDALAPLNTFSFQDGAGYFLLAEAMGGQLETPLAAAGQSRVTMDLRCWQIAEWQPVELAMDLPSTPVLSIRIPVASPSSISCAARVESQARLEGKWVAEARGTAEDSAQASADASFDFSVDGSSVLASVVATAAFAPSEGTQSDLVCNEKSASQLILGTRVASVLDTTTQMNVQADHEASAFVESSFNSWILSIGEALCPAIEPIVVVDLPNSPGGMTSNNLP